MKITVFDLETKNKPGKLKKGVLEAGADCGWGEKDKMGISVGISFDYTSGEYKTYLDDNVMELWELLVDSDMITGFNIVNFDIPLVAAQVINLLGPGATEKINRMAQELVSKSYDIFPVSKEGAGVTNPFTPGFKLDNHLELMYPHLMKTADGSEAPAMYKEGRMGELISYCIADVHRERLMFEHCWYAGWLMTKAHTDKYNIRRPQNQLGVEADIRLPFTLFPTTDKGLSTILADYRAPAAPSTELVGAGTSPGENDI